MKIAMIGQKGIPARSGGIERHVEELSVELVNQGHEVLVFCRAWYTWPIGMYKGVRCIKTWTVPTKHLDAIVHTFTSIVRAAIENVDVFHIHGVGPSLLAWLPKVLRPSASVVVTFHCVDRNHQKWGWFARLSLWLGEWTALHFPDATITVSQALQSYCKQTYERDSIHLPNGTRMPEDDIGNERLSVFHLEPNSYLMMCSRLVKHKGAHTLIEAWQRLQATDPDLVRSKKLVIVGGSAFTDSYVDEVKAMAKGDDSIVLTGVQYGQALRTLFANAYAVVHPSTAEGLPVAILEAMSYGKCVLSSDIAENAELTRHHGRLFETGNINDLADGMRWLFTHPAEVQEIGERAKRHVQTNYDWTDIAEATVNLYKTLRFRAEMSEVPSK